MTQRVIVIPLGIQVGCEPPDGPLYLHFLVVMGNNRSAGSRHHLWNCYHLLLGEHLFVFQNCMRIALAASFWRNYAGLVPHFLLPFLTAPWPSIEFDRIFIRC